MARRKVNKRSDGRYEKKITVGKDIDGKPIRKSFYSMISQADADKQAEQYKLKVQAGTAIKANIYFMD